MTAGCEPENSESEVAKSAEILKFETDVSENSEKWNCRESPAGDAAPTRLPSASGPNTVRLLAHFLF